MQHKHIALGVLTATVSWGLMALVPMSGLLSARVLNKPQAAAIPWRLITATEVAHGTTIPANTNVVFTIPDVVSPNGIILREVLLGNLGTKTRYWGYCFARPDQVPNSVGFPGDVFLSEAERDARDIAFQKALPVYSAFNPPKTESQLQKTTRPESLVHHQKEEFVPGDVCYIMSGGPLSIGTDLDGDKLNSQLERTDGTDLENPDSDGDGIDDGTEVLIGHTNPRTKDSDGDGIPDGTEDMNKNGRRDLGETDPNDRDSDKDGLCDGLCTLGKVIPLCPTGSGANTGDCPYSNRSWAAGEDKNLNGKVDTGETSPLLYATYGGISDMQRYYSCRISGKTDC